MVRDWSSYTDETVDLVTALLCHNLDHVVLAIFQYLDTFGLASATSVCSTWCIFIGRVNQVDVTLAQSSITEENINDSHHVVSRWSHTVPLPFSLRCRDTIQTISLSGSLLACGLQNGEVQLWCLLNYSLLGVIVDHGSPVTAISIARLPYDTVRKVWPVLVLSGSWKGELKIYSVHDASPLCPIRVSRLVNDSSISRKLLSIHS